VRNNPPVAQARVELSERPWERLTVEGRPHPHAFSRPGGERRTTRVTRTRQGALISPAWRISCWRSRRDRVSPASEGRVHHVEGDRGPILATAVKASGCTRERRATSTPLSRNPPDPARDLCQARQRIRPAHPPRDGGGGPQGPRRSGRGPPLAAEPASHSWTCRPSAWRTRTKSVATEEVRAIEATLKRG
jgi:hypothetical protein